MEELETLLKQHDWFYQYSDDMNYWRAGNDHHRKIIDKMEELGKTEEVLALYREYHPKRLR
jgi:hypothetical protein